MRFRSTTINFHSILNTRIDEGIVDLVHCQLGNYAIELVPVWSNLAEYEQMNHTDSSWFFCCKNKAKQKAFTFYFVLRMNILETNIRKYGHLNYKIVVSMKLLLFQGFRSLWIEAFFFFFFLSFDPIVIIGFNCLNAYWLFMDSYNWNIHSNIVNDWCIYPR